MEKLKIKAIVINETSFKESSKILNLLTEDKGIIGVISRGCKNIKSSLRSVSSKLTYGYFYINYKDDGLSTLTEVEVLNEFKSIKTSLEKIGFTSYLLDLARQVMKENENTDIFTILESALLKIENNFDPLVITNIVELKYLKYLGVFPVLDKCSKCDSTKDIVTISSKDGGYLCKNCINGEYVTDEKTVKLLRMFSFVDISKIKELNIKDINKKEINIFLENYYSEYTGLYLKSKDFLKQIKS